MTDEQPIPEGVADLDQMTEQEMVDEIVRRHNVPKYRGKKVETTHWPKEELKNLTFASRSVENSAHAEGRVMADMDDDALRSELDFRGVKVVANAKRATVERKLAEARVKFAMDALGYDEFTDDEKAAMNGVTLSAPKDDREVIIDGDAPAKAPEPAATSESAAPEEAPAPPVQPNATPAEQMLSADDVRRNLVDQMMAKSFPDSVVLDLLTAFRNGRNISYQMKITLPNGKYVNMTSVLEPPSRA